MSACIWKKINLCLKPRSLNFCFFEVNHLTFLPWYIYHLKRQPFRSQNDKKMNSLVFSSFSSFGVVGLAYVILEHLLFYLHIEEEKLDFLFLQLPDWVLALNEVVQFIEMNRKLCVFRKSYFCPKLMLCFASLWLSYSDDDTCQSSMLPCFKNPGTDMYCLENSLWHAILQGVCALL